MKKIFSFVVAVLFASSMMATEFLSIDFTQGQGEWTIQDVELGGLEFVWAQTEQYGMKATGYVDGNHQTESWLISPAIDLTGAETATLAFSHARKYGDLSQISVLAKAGEGEWTALEVSAWPDGSSWSFIDATADLAAFAGKAGVQVAFRYTSTTSGGCTWEIKTVTISDEGTPEPPVEDADVVFTGADFQGQGTEQTGSEVTASKDGVTFTCDKAYSDDAHSTLRCYKNSVITITSETEQIGKLVFQFYQTYTGDLANEVVVNAKEWTYTLPAQARIEKLSIYFGEAKPIDPVEIDEISVAEAMEIGNALADNAYTEVEYAVVGYAVSVKEYDTQYNNQTFYMSDDATAERGEFTAYRAKPETPVEAGQKVKVTGKIQKYVGDYGTTIEITGGKVEFVGDQGVENIVLGEQVQKVVVDGVVYIVRDNKLFNLQGAQVR